MLEAERKKLKKVQIVTVYNSLNPGSFLQAIALYRYLEKNKYEVSFLDTGARSIFKQTTLSVIYTIKRKRYSQIKNKISLGFRFEKQLSSYHIQNMDQKSNALYIIGSDEIWNVSRVDMRKYPIFWGNGLPLNKCISYAPSLNNATAEQLRKYAYVSEALTKMYAISVRDNYSCNELKKINNRSITVVCDPTVLLSRNEYEQMEAVCIEEAYVLSYIYNKTISQNDIDEIKRFAQRRSLKIVSFNQDNDWCDKVVYGTAADFLAYIHHAEYICTSTFHGTMFSAIYGKNFAVFGHKNRKVRELLEILNLDCLVSEKSLEEILENGNDNEQLLDRLNILRKVGEDYLLNNLGSIEL